MDWQECSYSEHGLELDCMVCGRQLLPDESDHFADVSYSPSPWPEEYDDVLAYFKVPDTGHITVCHRCLEPHIDRHRVKSGNAVTNGIPHFPGFSLTFAEACERYGTWAEETARAEGLGISLLNHPCDGCSKEFSGVWHLENDNGRLAKVFPDGRVERWQDEEE